MLNPFDVDAYNIVSLSQSINILPNSYGRLREMNLFPDKGVTTRTVILEIMNGVLNLLPTLPVGAPATQNKMGKRTMRSFMVPHIPLEDIILPDEYNGVRAFGSENNLATLAGVMNDHLQTMKNKFAITIEHLRMGALKGIILDSDGSVLYNLYNEFGVEPKRVDFLLGTTTTDVRGKCMEVIRHIEDNLMGEVMRGVRCFCDGGFFDKLTAHANVKTVFANTTLAKSYLGEDIRRGFSFGGITFEEYRGTATDKDGVVRRFIETNTGHAFPEGTMSTFKTIYAPADFLDTVNTVGIPLYAKQEMRKFERGLDLHVQSNPLPLCNRPNVLVEVYSSN